MRFGSTRRGPSRIEAYEAYDAAEPTAVPAIVGDVNDQSTAKIGGAEPLRDVFRNAVMHALMTLRADDDYVWRDALARVIVLLYKS